MKGSSLSWVWSHQKPKHILWHFHLIHDEIIKWLDIKNYIIDQFTKSLHSSSVFATLIAWALGTGLIDFSASGRLKE